MLCHGIHLFLNYSLANNHGDKMAWQVIPYQKWPLSVGFDWLGDFTGF